MLSFSISLSGPSLICLFLVKAKKFYTHKGGHVFAAGPGPSETAESSRNAALETRKKGKNRLLGAWRGLSSQYTSPLARL